MRADGGGVRTHCVVPQCLQRIGLKEEVKCRLYGQSDQVELQYISQ